MKPKQVLGTLDAAIEEGDVDIILMERAAFRTMFLLMKDLFSGWVEPSGHLRYRGIPIAMSLKKLDSHSIITSFLSENKKVFWIK